MNQYINFSKSDLFACISLFCLTLIISLTISPPAIFMNDEWIPLNQLSQVFSGHQFTVNEERYGKAFTGELSGYFSSRDNLLGYSLILPLISIPLMWTLVNSGDYSRLIIIFLWWICLMTIMLIIGINYYNQLNLKNKGIYWMGLFGIFGLLLLNLILYTPFQMTLPLRPVEVPAIIFTQEILLSLMAPIIYATMRFFYNQRLFSISASIITLCCSSYFFWASSAKDHLLVAFLLSIIVYSMAGFLVKNKMHYCLLSFFFSGLLIWARPEVGIFIFLFILIFYLLYKFCFYKRDNWIFQIKETIFPILGIIPGIIPFFINNKIITGNYFIPPQYYYIDRVFASKIPSVTGFDTQNLSTIQGALIRNSETFSPISFILKIFAFITPDLDHWTSDIIGIITITSGKAAGLFYLSPLVIPALLLFLVGFYTKKIQISHQVKIFLIFCCFVTVGIFIAYLRGLHGMNISMGVLPDVRYLSPIYLPLSFISICIIGCFWRNHGGNLLKSLIISLTFLTPIAILALLLIQSGEYVSSITSIGLVIFMGICIASILFVLSVSGKISEKWAIIWLSILITLPFVWQVFMTFVFSYFRINGYPLWIPIMEYSYNTYFFPIY